MLYIVLLLHFLSYLFFVVDGYPSINQYSQQRPCVYFVVHLPVHLHQPEPEPELAFLGCANGDYANYYHGFKSRIKEYQSF